MNLLIFGFLFGLAVGSFLNAWIYRLETGGSIAKGRSKCPSCGKILRIAELIPIFSFLIQKGRCRSCGWNIPIQYLILETVTAGLFVLAILANKGNLANSFRDAFFLSILLVIFVYDLKHKLIPDAAIIPGFLFAFFWNLGAGMPFSSLVLGIVSGGGFFLLQSLISKGKWIGEGDIRLGAMMGAMLGFPVIVLALFLAYISGAVTSLALVATGRATLKSAVPFGTFLALGTAISIFYGERIINLYLAQI